MRIKYDVGYFVEVPDEDVYYGPFSSYQSARQWAFYHIQARGIKTPGFCIKEMKFAKPWVDGDLEEEE